MASIDELKGLAVDERCRLVVVGTLLALLGYLTYYSHAVLGAETVFTHLFYIPIVLVCLWWKRYCLVVAVFLAALLMSSNLLFISDVPAVSDLVRACMFIVVGIVAAFISERLARTGEALRKSEQRFRELADSLPQVVFEADESGIITFANRNAFIQFGYTQEDFDRGINSLQCLAPDDRDRAMESIQRALGGEDVGSEEYAALRKDGSTFPALIHSAPIVHEGRVVGSRGIVVDITERKAAEQNLQKQQKEQQLILDTVPALIFYKDRENRFVRVNEAFAKTMGMAKEQIEGKSCFDIFPPAQAEKYWKDDREVMASKKPKMNIIEPLETAEGTRWVQTDKIPLEDEEGNVAGIIGFAFDITERKQMVDALRDSEESYRQIVETAEEGIWRIDASSTTTFVNHKMAHMLGYTRSEMLGEPLFAFMDDEEKERTREFIERRRGGIREQHESRFRHRDGRDVWTIVSTAPILNDDGSYVGALAMVTDITDRRAAGEQIRRLSQFLEASIDNASVWLDVMDEDGNVLIWNRAAEEISGYSRDEVLGKRTVGALLYPARSYRENISNGVLDKIHRGDTVRGLDTPIRTKSGKAKIISWGARGIFGEQGELVGSVVIGLDITEQKEMEKLRRRAYEQLESNIELFATLVDGIRNPLTVIVGLAGMRASKKSERMLQQCERIEEIIKSFDEGWLASENIRAFLKKYM